jgi:hypothetical protein
MIESVILTALTADTELKALVSTFNGQPAIFDGSAPEGVAKPYITFRVTWRHIDLMTTEFTVFIDFFDYGSSKVKARKAAERAEFIFDGKEFEHERYSNIRFLLSSGDYVPEEDPRTIHYNQMFEARASRKKFVEQL